MVLHRPCSTLWLLFIFSCLFQPLTSHLALAFLLAVELWYMTAKYLEEIKLYVAIVLLCYISCPYLCSHLLVFCNGLFTFTRTNFNGRNSRYHGRLLRDKFLGRVAGNFSKTLDRAFLSDCSLLWGVPEKELSVHCQLMYCLCRKSTHREVLVRYLRSYKQEDGI